MYFVNLLYTLRSPSNASGTTTAVDEMKTAPMHNIAMDAVELPTDPDDFARQKTGTANDQRDMARMGKRQELRVRIQRH